VIRLWTVRQRLIVASAIAVFALTGCAATTDYPLTTATSLREDVAIVSTSAANGDFSGALKQLDTVKATLDDALARGDVSAARYASISSSIELVRSDLESAIDAEQQSVAPTGKPGNRKGPGKKD
jgi:hypothetical protein